MSTITWLAAVATACLFSAIVYRLYLHPLAKISGPKLAAATSLYEFYYDCVLGGKYCFQIDKMHRRYGPCVRINPWEVHINDPAFWAVLYSNSNKLDKDKWYYSFIHPSTTVATASHDLHRTRRGAMSTYFSLANVRKLEPIVLSRIQKLCDRLEEYRKENRPVNLSNAFRCLATDVVTYFAYPKPRSMLDTPDFSKDFTRLLRDVSALLTWQRHLKVVFPILLSIPDSITLRMDTTGGSRQMIDFQHSFFEQSKMAVDRKQQQLNTSDRSILDTIATSPQLNDNDKTVNRVAFEAQAIYGAGTETTGATLSVCFYHVLAKPTICARLKEELNRARAGSRELMDTKTLENLPYLQACLAEALRIASPVSGRLPRVNPRAEMTYTDPNGKLYRFPKGTAMSMTMRDLHFNADIFPEPSTFNPDRWLGASAKGTSKMQRPFVPFSTGTRNCIGQELAKQELTLAAGNLLHRFDLQLFETTERDVGFAHDWFSPFAELDSEGLRVMVR